MEDEVRSFEMAVFSVEPMSFRLRSQIHSDNILLHAAMHHLISAYNVVSQTIA